MCVFKKIHNGFINAISYAECNITELDVISIIGLRKEEPRAKA